MKKLTRTLNKVVTREKGLESIEFFIPTMILAMALSNKNLLT